MILRREDKTARHKLGVTDRWQHDTIILVIKDKEDSEKNRNV